MDAEAAVHARAVNADEDGVADAGPGRLGLPAIEAPTVLLLQAHPLEHGYRTLVFHNIISSYTDLF